MSIQFPQAACSLRILFEDFGKNDAISNKEQNLIVTPRSIKVSINDYTKADEFEMELDYKNFPFDPRTIRSLGVTVFLEDVKAHVDKVGNFKPIEPKGTESEFIRTSTPGSSSIVPSNAIFVGFADEDKIVFSSDTRTIRIKGRDFTALFIDSPWDLKKSTLPLTSPLPTLIAYIAGRLKATKPLNVDLRGLSSSDLPPLAAFYPDFATGKLAGNRNSRRNESYWDVIQDIASKAGVIVYVDRDLLVITKPNAIYNRKNLKQFVWGRNVANLEFTRKLGRTKNFNIMLRSANLRLKKVETVRIPEDASLEFQKSTGVPRKRIKIKELNPDGTVTEKDANFIVFRIPDVASKTQLTNIGEKIFEELSRQQIEGNLETWDMHVREGEVGSDDLSAPFSRKGGIEFDATKIRVGTAIDLRLAEDDFSEIQRESSKEAKRQYLINKCYDPVVASIFADAMGKFDTPFYTKAVEFTFDSDNGFKMSLDFVNFIELPQSLVSL